MVTGTQYDAPISQLAGCCSLTVGPVDVIDAPERVPQVLEAEKP